MQEPTSAEIINNENDGKVIPVEAVPVLDPQYIAERDDLFHAGVKAGAAACHEAAATWWIDKKTGQDVRTWPKHFFDLWISAKLMLVVSEVSEANEGLRKDKMDDHLPHRKMLEVELADTVIRVFDLAGGLKLDLAGAITEKLEYNAHRADHKPENRAKEGGKSF